MATSNCVDPGCYKKEVTYTAPMKQMKALMEISKECHQLMKVFKKMVIAPISLKIFQQKHLIYQQIFSTTAWKHLWSMMAFNTLTGMIQTDCHKTFGQETGLEISISVSVESIKRAKSAEPSTQTLNATVTTIHLPQLLTLVAIFNNIILPRVRCHLRSKTTCT